MKVKQIIVFLFLTVVISQLYLPSFKLNIVIQLIALLIMLSLNEFKISIRILNLLIPLFLIFGIGFIGFFANDFQWIQLVKDSTHFLKPILGLMLGYVFFQKIDFKTFIKLVVITGFCTAFFHIFLVLFNSKLTIETMNAQRNVFGKDNFLESFSLLFFCFYRTFFGEMIFKSKKLNYFIFFTLVLSCFFYFSRTMIVVLVLGVLTVYGYTKVNARNMKIFLGLVAVISLFYIYLFSIKIDRNGKGMEAFLYKVKIAPAEMFKTKIDRKNHKELWDHWRGYEAKRALHLMSKNPASYAVGTGFGSLIDLKFKAPLDEEGIRYISETHNGYIYIFYKTGAVGLFLLFVFLLNFYRFLYSDFEFVPVFIGVIAVCFFFTTLTITGIYNPRDVIIILLGGLVAYSSKSILKQKEE